MLAQQGNGKTRRTRSGCQSRRWKRQNAPDPLLLCFGLLLLLSVRADVLDDIPLDEVEAIMDDPALNLRLEGCVGCALKDNVPW